MQAHIIRNVCQDVGEAFTLLKLIKFMLKPFELLSRIGAIGIRKQPPVEIIAGLRVHRNHFSSPIEWERFWIVTVLAKNLNFFLSQPVGILPSIFQVVDGVILTRLWEIMNIYRPRIMVTNNGKDRNVFITECILERLCDIECITSDFFIWITPNVMTRVVTSPSNEICFQRFLVITNEVKHALHCPVGDVAVVVAPFLGHLCLWMFFQPVLVWYTVVSAANDEVTVCGCTLLISIINMNISYLNWSPDSSRFLTRLLTFNWVSLNIGIQIVNKIVILQVFRFVTKLLLYPFIHVHFRHCFSLAQVKEFVTNSALTEKSSSQCWHHIFAVHFYHTGANRFLTASYLQKDAHLRQDVLKATPDHMTVHEGFHWFHEFLACTTCVCAWDYWQVSSFIFDEQGQVFDCLEHLLPTFL